MTVIQILYSGHQAFIAQDIHRSADDSLEKRTLPMI
jgi:hypothetical protein